MVGSGLQRLQLQRWEEQRDVFLLHPLALQVFHLSSIVTAMRLRLCSTEFMHQTPGPIYRIPFSTSPNASIGLITRTLSLLCPTSDGAYDGSALESGNFPFKD
jgi:hypothetical protein